MAEDNTTPENSNEDTNQTEAKSGQTQIKNNQALIKKILIIAIATLVILLGIIIAIFLTHSTSEEAIETTMPVETNQSIQASQTTTENVEQTPSIQNTQTAEPKDTRFDFNNLDPEELNEQLALLTNKSMIQEAEELKNNNIEEQKEEDIVSLLPQNFQNKVEELKPTNKENNEQTTSLKETQQQATQENTNQNDVNNSIENEENTINNNQPLPFVKLINVAKIKGKLYKKYFDKAVLVNPDILLCRDEDNNIELYYVLLDDKLRDELLSKLLKQGFTEAYILDMLEDEFNKRCKY